MNSRVKWVGWGAGWSLIGAAWLAGCSGGDFQNQDCVETHICATTGGDGSQQDGGASSDAGSPSKAGSSATGATGGTKAIAGSDAGGSPVVVGGAGGNGGEAPAICATDDDCSNGDPTDGVELCQPGGSCIAGNAPPYVISTMPTEGSTNVAADSLITLVFSEAVDAASATSDTVQLKLGDDVVDATVKVAEDKVTLTPKAPLVLLGEYTVVATGVKDAEGAPLLAPFQSAFTSADGSWSPSHTIVSNNIYQLSDTVPMTATGDALIAWTANVNNTYCPPKAAWYRGGNRVGAEKVVDLPGATDCNSISAGGNANGIVGLSWNVPDPAYGTYVEQLRGGKWAASPDKLAAETSSWLFRVGASPTGALSVFSSSGNTTSVRHSDAAGKWVAKVDVLTDDKTTPVKATPLAAPQVAYDGAGNGVAVWRARDATLRQEILVSYFTGASGKWSAAAILPGSQATVADAKHSVGAPAIAMDEQGNAMVLWVAKGTGTASSVFASRYVADGGGWTTPVTIPSAHTLFPESLSEPPAVVFDGKSFIGAFSADDNDDGEKPYTFTTWFNREKGTWSSAEKRQTANEVAPSDAMPKLASDGRGHLHLLWITSSDRRIMSRRLAGGVWGQSVQLGTLPEKGTLWPVGSSATGAATVVWLDLNDTTPLSIQIASFY